MFSIQNVENQKELNEIRARQQKETIDTLNADLEEATEQVKLRILKALLTSTY